MKLLIDGYWWAEGPVSNRMALLEIVRQWTVDYPDDELIVATPNCDEHHPNSPAVEVVRTRLRVHPAINFVELPMIARRRGADAILSFNFAANSKSGVLFLHDVLFQSNPEWFTRIERAYFRGMPLLAPRARSVIATSRSECARISQFNPRLSRVVSCGLAVPTSLSTATEIDPALGLTRNGYLLSVGRLNVRKNLAVTLRAAIRSGVVSQSFPLVVVGEPSGRSARFDDEVSAAVASGAVRFVEKVSDGELKWLYTHCALFIYLSLGEGFGLPPVEAASLGCRVLVSDLAVFRETVGSHATLVDPSNVGQIADTIRELTEESWSADPIGYREEHSWRSVCAVIRSELESAPAPLSVAHASRD